MYNLPTGKDSTKEVCAHGRWLKITRECVFGPFYFYDAMVEPYSMPGKEECLESYTVE